MMRHIFCMILGAFLGTMTMIILAALYAAKDDDKEDRDGGKDDNIHSGR